MKTSQIKNLTPGGKLRHPMVWVREWTSKQEQEQLVKSGSQSKSLGGRAPYSPEGALGTAQMCPRPPRVSGYLKSSPSLTGQETTLPLPKLPLPPKENSFIKSR